MTEIILTPEQYMGTVVGAGMVFLMLGMLAAFFYDRALAAERRAKFYLKALADMKEAEE